VTVRPERGKRTRSLAHQADGHLRLIVGPGTEHVPAARVVHPSELDVTGQVPGDHRSGLRPTLTPPHRRDGRPGREGARGPELDVCWQDLPGTPGQRTRDYEPPAHPVAHRIVPLIRCSAPFPLQRDEGGQDSGTGSSTRRVCTRTPPTSRPPLPLTTPRQVSVQRLSWISLASRSRL
jgi:hypothetical protein